MRGWVKYDLEKTGSFRDNAEKLESEAAADESLAEHRNARSDKL